MLPYFLLCRLWNRNLNVFLQHWGKITSQDRKLWKSYLIWVLLPILHWELQNEKLLPNVIMYVMGIHNGSHTQLLLYNSLSGKEDRKRNYFQCCFFHLDENLHRTEKWTKTLRPQCWHGILLRRICLFMASICCTNIKITMYPLSKYYNFFHAKQMIDQTIFRQY